MRTKTSPVAYSTSLGGFFNPRSVAVIGASARPMSVGRTLLTNLLSQPFGGTVYPVNPKRRSVMGVKAYATLSEIGEPVDLAIIATAPSAILDLVTQCRDGGVKNVILMSSFRETEGGQGAGERALLEIAAGSGMRVLGPHSLGVIVPSTGFNATVTSGRARPGRIGVVSQSGTMCSAILDWCEQANVGFSSFVSIGQMADVSWGDLIYYLGDDPNTRCIILYMERIGDPKPFLSAAREVANIKPIVVMKGGRRPGSVRATPEDEGLALTSDEVLDSALSRSGVLRVNAIEDLFRIAEVLGKQPAPTGRRMAIISNAGGPAVLAADALAAEGGALSALSPETVAELDKTLPFHWSKGNPVMGLGDKLENIYPQAVRTIAKDPAVDGVLLVLTPKPSIDATLIAEKVREASRGIRVPVLTSWMGGESVEAGRAILRDEGIPAFPFPDSAARIFNYMWRYRENLNALYETPEPLEAWDFHHNDWVRESIRDLLARARAERCLLLTDIESKKILEAYGIPVLKTLRAVSPAEAVNCAREIGYPVAVEALIRVPSTTDRKRFSVLSELLDYRGDESLSWPNLKTPEDVVNAFDLIEADVRRNLGAEVLAGVSVRAMPARVHHLLTLGSDVDPQFGPVIYFGRGGVAGQQGDEYSVGLPPMNANLARRLMEQSRAFRSLREFGQMNPSVLASLSTIITRFAQLVIDLPMVREIRIDPLIVSADGVHAGGVNLILLQENAQPRTRMAIRPYPSEYIKAHAARDGEKVLFRPIRPEDEPSMISHHRSLSDQTVYNRYFSYMHVDQRTRHEKLSRDCFTDYDRNMILVVERHSQPGEIVGVGRLIRIRGSNEAEFAVHIADSLQGKGLGSALLAHLIHIARQEEMDRVVGHVLEGNEAMVRLCREYGFSVRKEAGQETVRVALDLKGAGAPGAKGAAGMPPQVENGKSAREGDKKAM